MTARAVSTLSALLVVSCSLLIDTNLEEGYPCQDEPPYCLSGYRCKDGLCVSEPDDPSWDPCEGACGELERCDRETATCVPICHGVICPTGDVCLDTAGGCTQMIGGLGQLCDDDLDCEDVLQGCSPDPHQPGEVRCACVVPATMARHGAPRGICLGLPVNDPTDCSACGDAKCLMVELSSASSTGESGLRAVCAPKGFGPCGGDADCHLSEGHTVCTYFGWPSDPEPHGWPEGLFSACATPSWDFAAELADPCDPFEPLACDTGLCVPITQGRHACTVPCDGDAGCYGRLDACLETRVILGRDETPILWDVAGVCGQGPTLGDVCELGDPALSPCGTDAPVCISDTAGEEYCTRECRKHADCGDDGAYSCTDFAGERFCMRAGGG